MKLNRLVLRRLILKEIKNLFEERKVSNKRFKFAVSSKSFKQKHYEREIKWKLEFEFHDFGKPGCKVAIIDASPNRYATHPRAHYRKGRLGRAFLDKPQDRVVNYFNMSDDDFKKIMSVFQGYYEDHDEGTENIFDYEIDLNTANYIVNEKPENTTDEREKTRRSPRRLGIKLKLFNKGYSSKEVTGINGEVTIYWHKELSKVGNKIISFDPDKYDRMIEDPYKESVGLPTTIKLSTDIIEGLADFAKGLHQ